ncbi:MAG: hypothetical protein ACYDBS_07345, partial [Acidimicrobiales bacterium]
GASTVVLRLPSVVASGVTAAAVAAIGSRLAGRRTALGAGLISAVSVSFVYWGQDARAYAWMFALGALSYLGFVAMVAGESRSRPGSPPRWAAPLYSIALLLAIYMSLVAVLLVPAQLLSLYWYRRRFRLVAISIVVPGVLSLPLAVLAHSRGTGQLFWVPRPDLNTTAQLVQTVMSSSLPPLFALTSTSLLLLSATTVLLVVGAVLAVRRARRQPIVDGITPKRWATALVAAWLVVPILLDLVESFVGQSIYQARYLLISAPAVALALAWVLLESRVARALRWSALAVLLVLRGLQVLPTYGVSPENWQAATAYVLGHASAGDCIAFYPSDGRQAFGYYVEALRRPRSRLLRPVLPRAPFAVVRPYVEDYATLSPARLSAVAHSCPRLWLVSSHVGIPHATPISELHYLRYESLVHRLAGAFAHSELRQFSYASPIDVWLFKA